MSMSQLIQSIESQDMALATLFNDFYVVPDYQREYVWLDEQVEQLLDDIYTEFSSTGAQTNAEYFIGSIVVCPRSDGVLELIDGQQRMTTTYLFLCALRNYFKLHNQQSPKALDAQISATTTDDEGNDVFRYRVDLQYEDSGDVLQAIAKENGNIETVAETTLSIKNIKNAYQLIMGFFEQNFGTNAQELKKFYAFFTGKVKLIRIRTQSVAHALKIFETINDRGKGLDSMDLLKNLMFMHARATDFEVLKKRWKELVDTLYNGGEKPLRFLRYFIFANYDNVDRLREDEIYAWFVTNEPQCGYRTKPLVFVNELLAAAKAYINFLNGRDARGNPNRYLQNIQYMSGAARQHLILLLTARDMPPEIFSELCRHVENLFFIHIIARENTREFERKFAQWTDELKPVRTQVELDRFLAARLEPTIQMLAQRFDFAFREMQTSSIQKYRMRYVLGKLTQYVNEQAFGSVGAVLDLGTFVNVKVHVEHILPQTLTDEVRAELDSAERVEEYIQRLGNLALVEMPLNTSLGNKPYSQKHPVYAHSQFLLTKSIAERVVIGSNTTVDRAVRDLEPFSAWGTAAIDQRQDQLRLLARRVWDVPDVSQ
jgi:uncharacterized protein with ParB-like and HNH nuclease domain